MAAVIASPLPARGVQLPPAAQPVPAAPGTGSAPAGATLLEATVAAVKGVVQTRPSEDKPWVAATVGMKVGQGADIRTGLRSAVQLTVEPDQTITLDRLGTVKVLQAFQNQGKVTTDIGMKYGRAQYDIKKTNLEHASTIRSPGSTLALRGTNVVYEDQAPWVPTAVSREGRAEFRNLRRQVVAFGGTKRAVVSGDTGGPGQKALAKTTIDPKSAFSGRTESEDQLLIGLSSRGGVDAQGLQAIQEIIRGFGAEGGSVIASVTAPGPLQFQLLWDQPGTTTITADVDLLVTDPEGRTATFRNPKIGTGTSAGLHQGNDRGMNGRGGESVVWPFFFPVGQYTATIVNRTGPDARVLLSLAQGDAEFKVLISDVPGIVLSAGQSVAAEVTVPISDSTTEQAQAKPAKSSVKQKVGIVAGAQPAFVSPAKVQRPFTGPREAPARVAR